MQPVDKRSLIDVWPVEAFCCQNTRCSLYGQKGQGNLGQKGWSDRKKTIRILICKVCGRRFSERKGTALYHVRLSTEKALNVLRHLQDHCGIRQTSRLTGVRKSTVNRLAKIAGDHADNVHDELVAFSPQHAGSSARRNVVVRSKKRKTL